MLNRSSYCSLVRRKKLIFERCFSPRYIKYVSRRRIESGPLLRRLDAVSSCVQEHPINLGSPSGPFRVRMEPTAPPFRELVSKPQTTLVQNHKHGEWTRSASNGKAWTDFAPPVQFYTLRSVELLKEEADLVLLTPFWPSQPWFPTAMELSCDAPRLLQSRPNLLTSSLGESHPLIQNNSIRLIAWRPSGVSLKKRGLSESDINLVLA